MDKFRRPLVFWALGILTALFFFALSSHIDFHPDEAIYFNAIPVNLRSDSGAFFNLVYLLVQKIQPGPEGARAASALLGGVTFAFLLLALELRQALSVKKIALLFCAYAFSYQAIFIFDRVRPEAAWWCCAVIAGYALSFTRKNGLRTGWPLLILVGLLPMNHRLSWFACAFIVGYLLLFCHRRSQRATLFFTGVALLAGAFLNVTLRAWWLGIPLLDAFHGPSSTPAGLRQPLGEFLEATFQNTPTFLNDIAQNPNIYSWVIPGMHTWTSHEFIQNTLWVLMIVLPLIGRNWIERYVLAFPLFSFFAFWLSGYYNPTYAAGFSLYCVVAMAYAGAGTDHRGWLRFVSILMVAVSIINGISFLVTRVMNHGPATYFGVERSLHALADTLPDSARIAVPERFLTAVSNHPFAITNDSKEIVLSNVDMMVIDSYDEFVYQFVPDFSQKRAVMNEQKKRMCLAKKFMLPVYARDAMFSDDPVKLLTIPGSWFFRNSAAYSLEIYLKCAANAPEH